MNGTSRTSLWISWYPHRRTSGLCDAWGIPLEVIHSKHTGLRKWANQALATLALVRQRRPDILFVQNPSLGLTALALWVRWFFGYYLVVDAHNEGVRPFVRSSALVQHLTRHLLKRANATIVTNSALAEDVQRAGGNPLILPDRLPVPPVTVSQGKWSGVHPPDVVVISTYAPDEPLAAILAAARRMPGTRFAVTGNSSKFVALGLDLPANVELTGFLSENEYWNTLVSSKVIVDLTLMPDCLVCGAYEGLAIARPMVLSDNPATRELFGHGAILTGGCAEEVLPAIQRALAEQHSLQARALEAREAFRLRWESQARCVREAIAGGLTPDCNGNAAED